MVMAIALLVCGHYNRTTIVIAVTKVTLSSSDSSAIFTFLHNGSWSRISYSNHRVIQVLFSRFYVFTVAFASPTTNYSMEEGDNHRHEFKRSYFDCYLKISVQT